MFFNLYENLMLYERNTVLLKLSILANQFPNNFHPPPYNNNVFLLISSYYWPIGTKNAELSAIRINLLSILNFLKLNPKNVAGSIKHGGGSVLEWGV
ncbi:UNVERIFIED_CONTAM: hypothetical protein NCL1_40724 [Trichonephila clavipes]